jgi:NadR type nicotinamide-nucleotide adenylyltransferase
MIRKIVLTGPESTGKSSLAEALAKHYKTVWVPEYARTYLESLGRPYEKHDLVEIARGQIKVEDELVKKANKMLFCDTDLTVIKIWHQHKYGNVHPFILENLRHRKYDLYLLPFIDLPWKYDPQREHPHLRSYLFDLYEKELQSRRIDYMILKGNHKQRFTNAVKAIEFAQNNWR